MMLINLEMECPFCGNAHFVEVFENDYFEYLDGKLVQEAFPYMSATKREQIISHICPSCQESIFGADEAEEEGDNIFLCEMESLGGNWW